MPQKTKEVMTKGIYFLILTTAILGLINSPMALLLGFIFSLVLQNPFQKHNHLLIGYLLKVSIIGLGFGMLIKETIQASTDSLSLTFYSILLTMALGLLLIKLLKIDFKLGYLITSGTSICGGSAIAAISAIIKPDTQIISMALGIVFLLNSIALFIFPIIGEVLDLNQTQFGMWCAIAIHDTSSVVGAAVDYGDEALRIATTVKLSRTLWIIPLSIFSMFFFKRKKEQIKIPYFIVLFIFAIFINSSEILPSTATNFIVSLSKRLLVLTLFLVGTTLSIKDLKTAGIKPIFLGLTLWFFISVFSLLYIVH
jgi:uncharacterized integral membrane protein (TIGR00698 family)